MILQVSIPCPPDPPNDRFRSIVDLLTQRWYMALAEQVETSPGGVTIARPVVSTHSHPDEQMITVRMSAEVTPLPAGDSFALVGGPADGRIIVGNGSPQFRVLISSNLTATNERWEPIGPPRRLVALYDRLDRSVNAYHFREIREE